MVDVGMEYMKILKTEWSEVEKLKTILGSKVMAHGKECVIVGLDTLKKITKKEIKKDGLELHYDINLELERIASGYDNGCKYVMVTVNK